MRSIFNYINELSGDNHDMWFIDKCDRLAGLSTPDFLIGLNKEVLLHDTHSLWANWFIDSFIKDEYLSTEYLYGKAFKDVYAELIKFHPKGFSEEELRNLSRLIANLIERKVIQFNKKKKRVTSYPEDVIDKINNQLEKSPRCWLTGNQFPDEALDRFFNNSKLNSKPRKYIDRYLPIGEKEGDLNIEIDHLYPFSLGGEDIIDNYRPICRWANKAKSNNTYIYDRRLTPIHPLDIQYYWILRIMGTKRRCSHFNCDKNISNSRLVAASSFNGMLNPISITLYCDEHDPSCNSRWILNR